MSEEGQDAQTAPRRSPRETLELMLGHLGFVFEIEEETRPTGLTLHIRTRTPARLIGKDGKTLEELQFLLNRILSKGDAAIPRVIIDVENYRSHQQDELLAQMKGIIEEVRSTGNPAELPILNSFDRRIVHLAYQDDPEIEITSPEGVSRLKKMTVRRKMTS